MLEGLSLGDVVVMMQDMIDAGHVEVIDDPEGGEPHYRLTDAGIEHYFLLEAAGGAATSP